MTTKTFATPFGGRTQAMSILDREQWADDRWDYVEQVGAVDDVEYEDDDQRIGGNDNPYQED